MTVVTPPSSTGSHSLNKLAEHRALCQRLQLPLCLLGIQIRQLQQLKQEIGQIRFRRLQNRIHTLLEQQTRTEDSIIIWHRGHLLLSLPATPVSGALTLAKRLQWLLAEQEYDLDDYRINLATVMAVHYLEPQHSGNLQEQVDHTLSLLASHNDEHNIKLSSQAQAQEKPAYALLLNTLQQLNRPSQDPQERSYQEMLKALRPALCRLNQQQQMALVDVLLDASLQE